MHSLLQWSSQSLLSLAAERGLSTITRLLLQRGTNPNFWDGSGLTPLSRAVQRRHDTITRLLLENDARPDMRNAFSRTPLSLAAEDGQSTLILLLLETGKVNVNAKDNEDRTPLLWAVRENHETVVKLLLEKGADLESEDVYGLRPLAYATNAAVRQLLESHGAQFLRSRLPWTNRIT
jgi:ankyrin repeat protein